MPGKAAITRPGAKMHSPDYRAVRIRTETNGRGTAKTIAVAGLILLQFLLLACLYVYLGVAFRWFTIVSLTFSLLAAVHVLSGPRNGLSKAVWILFLLVAFGFGYVVYILSDERIFFRKARRRYAAVFARAEAARPDFRPPSSQAVAGDARFLYEAGGFAPYTDTAVRYFPSGAQLFDDVLARLQTAERYIYIEFFIVADGVLLDRLLDVLRDRAAHGVDVRLIYDDMGSHGTLSRRAKRRLTEAGVRIRPFNRLLPRFTVALNYRDHRKIVAIDGRTAYTGGSNLADEYINEKRMHGYWKDTGVRLDGPAADAFTLFFLRQWEFLTGEKAEYAALSRETGSGCGPVVIPFADGPDHALSVGKNAYLNVIVGAAERLYIMTPYFIPDEALLDLLAVKARSGVDVRLILPGVPDKRFVYAMSLNYAEKLIGSGVKIYRMRDSFVHSKLMLSEKCVVIGSINLDLRSFYQQFECALLTDDPAAVRAVADDFAAALPECERVGDDSRPGRRALSRVFAGFLQLFAPFM